MNSAMLPQKCTYFIRRFLEMGPRTAAWLVYHRVKKRLFIAVHPFLLRSTSFGGQAIQTLRPARRSHLGAGGANGCFESVRGECFANFVSKMYRTTKHSSKSNLIPIIRTDHTFDFLQTQQHPDAYHAADRVANRTFTILGHLSHTFAQDITWHQDFTCMTASPQAWQKTFYAALTIPAHADTPQPDIKVPWELSRLECCRDLGYGYVRAKLDNDSDRAHRYTQAFVTYIEDWVNKNPFLFGVNWVNPMEVALRGINLVRALHLFKHESCITDTFWESYGTLLVQHINYLEHNWEVSDRPNNHYLADLVGHFYLCTCLRFIARYDRTRRSTTRKICGQLKHQILPDGTSYEGSTHYHQLVMQLIKLFVELADYSTLTLPAQLRSKLARMQQFTTDCSDHAGKLVLIGDEDGGSVENPRSSCAPRYTSPPARHSEQSVFIPFALRVRHSFSDGGSVLRSLGAGGCIEGAARTGSKSTCSIPLVTYPHFGLSIIKDSHIHLTFRHPTYAPHQPTGHFHNDQLSLTLSINGIPLLVDPGTYCYTANAHERNYFRSFAAHNTFYMPAITTDTTHLFMLNRHQHPHAPQAHQHNTRIILQDFYHADPDIQLYRRVTYHEQTGVLEIDDWSNLKELALNRNCELHWSLHLAPGITVVHETENRWTLTRNGVCCAQLQTSLAYTVHHDVVSPQYGLKIASTTLRAVTSSRAPQRMVLSLLHKEN